MIISQLRTASRATLLALVTLGALGAVVLWPSLSRTQAGSRTGDGSRTADKNVGDGLPNYDIRLDTKAIEKLAAFRSSMNRSASAVADIRDRFAAAEA